MSDSDFDEPPPRRGCLGPVGGTIVVVAIAARVILLVYRMNSHPTPDPIPPQPTPTPIVTPTPAPFMAPPVVQVPTAVPTPTPRPVVPTPKPLVWAAPATSTIYPTVWVTKDGKTYQNVQVKTVEPDRVTITYDQDAISMVPIETLPPNIQALLNYDPVEAGKAAAKHFMDQLNDKDGNTGDDTDDKTQSH